MLIEKSQPQNLQDSANSSSKILNLVCSIFLFALSILVVSPIPTIPGRDSGVFLYVGQQLLQGKVPYRDVWDHKPPVIFVINALGLLISGNSIWGVWLLQVLAVGGAALLGFWTLRKVFGLVPAFFGSVAWLSSIIYLLGYDNFTEEYALIFQISAVWLFYRLLQTKRYALYGSGLGLTFAITLLLKQNIIGLWAVIVLYLLVFFGSKREWVGLLRSLGAFTGAALLVVLLTLGYFFANNALEPFIDIAFRYNFSYSDVTNANRLEAIFEGFLLLSQSRVSQLAVVTWVIIPFYLYRQWKAKKITAATKPWLPLVILAFFDWPFEITASSLSGRSYGHYYICVLPSVSILVAFFCYLLVSQWIPVINKALIGRTRPKAAELELTKRNNLLSLVILLPVLCIMLLTPIVFAIAIFSPRIPTPQQTSDQAAIDYVKTHTQASDYVLMWGAETHVNFVAKRQSPTRFTYQYALINYPARRDEYVKEFLQNLQDHKPALIIDSTAADGNQLMPPLDSTARQTWLTSDPPYTLPNDLNSVFDFVSQNYEMVGQLGEQHWPVYLMKTH